MIPGFNHESIWRRQALTFELRWPVLEFALVALHRGKLNFGGGAPDPELDSDHAPNRRYHCRGDVNPRQRDAW